MNQSYDRTQNNVSEAENEHAPIEGCFGNIDFQLGGYRPIKLGLAMQSVIGSPRVIWG